MQPKPPDYFLLNTKKVKLFTSGTYEKKVVSNSYLFNDVFSLIFHFSTEYFATLLGYQKNMNFTIRIDPFIFIK